MPFSPNNRFTFYLVVNYAIGGAMWILLSDMLLAWLTQPQDLVQISFLKGLIFIAATSLLLYLVLYRHPNAPEHLAEVEKNWNHRNWLDIFLFFSIGLLILLFFIAANWFVLHTEPHAPSLLAWLLYVSILVIGGMLTGIIWQRRQQRVAVEKFRHDRALRTAENQLRLQSAALEASANAIVITDRNAVIQWANPAFAQLTGYTTQEALGHKPRELIYSGMQPKEFYRNLWDTITSGQVWRGELINKRKDGMLYHEELTITPVYCENHEARNTGVICNFIAIKQDISERKRHEATLRDSEQRLNLALEGAALGVWDWHIPSGHVTFNTRWAEMLGYTLAELQPNVSTWEQLVHPDDWPRIHAALDSHLRGETPRYASEHRLRHKRGHWLWTLDSGKVLERDARGQAVRAVGIHQDINARKQAEADLAQSEAWLREAQTVAKVGSWHLDIVNNLLTWSDETHRIFDIAPGAPLNLDIFLDKVHPADRDALARAWDAACQGSDYDIEHRVVTKDNAGGKKIIWVRERAQVRFNPQGQPIEGIGTVQDITELKEARERLERLNQTLEQRVAQRTEELNRALRLKDEFLASMSHELRTPLNAILTVAEMLNDQLIGPLNTKQAQYLSVISDSGQQLLALITDVLEMSKITAGHAKIQLEDVDVQALCASCVTMLKTIADKKQLHLQVAIHPTPLRAHTDRFRLRQILINLLGNAVKFTPEHRNIGLEVEVDATAGLLSLTVWDEGIGIAQQDMANLFMPFVQLDGGLNRAYEGSGLGLALVKKNAELLQGSVHVHSELGRGSRFTVLLPWQANTAQDKPAATSPVDVVDSRTQTPLILFVDDNETTAETYTDYFRAKGYQTLAASNGNEALQVLETQRPDVLVLDMQMPEMDGMETMRRIRARQDNHGPEHGRTLPILALTALAMAGDKERCLQAGADAYLAKPVPLKVLEQTLLELLADPETRAQPGTRT